MDKEQTGNEIKNAIRNEIKKEYLQSMIDQLIRDIIQGELSESKDVDADAVVGHLLDSTAVQSLIERLGVTNQKSQHQVPSAINVPQNIKDEMLGGRQYLYLKICGGRAFMDHLGVSNSGGPHQPFFVIHVALQTQRYKTRRISCECDPQISEGFLFDLQQLKPGYAAKTLDAAELLSLTEPITLIVVKEGQVANPTLVSVYTLEWHSLLTQPSSSCKFVCQLMGIGAEHQVPVGLLDIEATLLPPVEKVIPHKVFVEHLHSTETRIGEKRRLFVSYAREWWREYTEASEKHRKRMVRIFAMDECGKNRFVCEFVRILEVGQALKSPEEAARWVSVLPTILEHQLPAGPTKPWYTLGTAVIAGSLNIESKCSLLCSLLLGFGLDAWICVGTNQSGQPQVWIMTRGPYTAVTFWESITGSRYLHRVGQRAAHGYATVGSVFNNKAFYANCQVSEKIEYCSFVLEDATIWKKMSYTATSSIVEKEAYHLKLVSPVDNGNERKINMEKQLKILIMEHRNEHGLSTHFDDHLSYVLTPALWSYEREAIDSGGLAEIRSAEFFSAALMNTVPEGYTFKGFPLHFMHSSSKRAFSAISNSSIGREIIECRGDNVTLAVRAITTCYPENVFVTWVMVACTFRQLG
ncbi:centrosomal protein of 76 kDa-like isoform X4 [Portunus trituberculatus]|uniref:centrosomal protein of 76 kDa-like isoform X4 n=1 Tax=Portunus trituberculatus TaxID=210409 RepID=UPI001E1CC704|nr:centrosomal protein of 76 kDa-like isoform X4 [Portunus trituberculatus]